MIKNRTVLSSLTVVLVLAFASVCSSQPRYDHKVEQWGLEEIVLQSSQHYKNPFREVTLSASLECTGERQTVTGFYDGDSTWKVRFMPQRLGHCDFQTTSNNSEINHQSGSFDVTSPTIGNQGPVHVAKTYHFSYSNGTPYFLLGTTLYNWLNRDEALQRETLDTLGHSSFTKVRFGLFPKWFIFNHEEPTIYPYVETSPGSFDLDQFNPRFFQSVERRIAELEKMGIEADLILFHPYDHLGFARMDADHDDAYIRYVAARLSRVQLSWDSVSRDNRVLDDSAENKA
jgi:hypothetical protein